MRISFNLLFLGLLELDLLGGLDLVGLHQLVEAGLGVVARLLGDLQLFGLLFLVLGAGGGEHPHQLGVGLQGGLLLGDGGLTRFGAQSGLHGGLDGGLLHGLGELLPRGLVALLDGLLKAFIRCHLLGDTLHHLLLLALGQAGDGYHDGGFVSFFHIVLLVGINQFKFGFIIPITPIMNNEE